MSKKDCELCSKPARMFCESDQASLCWDCDEKVHAANFLVAKHSRTLLCHVCRSPTPWKAAGPKLRPTVSVCQTCADDGENRGASSSNRRENERDFDSDSQESESDDGEYDSDIDDEDEGENQVVPWAATASDCCSEGDISLSSSSSKRLIRDYASSFDSEDEEDGCYSSQNRSSELGSCRLNLQESESNYCSSSPLSLSRPLKTRRTSDVLIPGGGQTEANTAERRPN